MNEDKINNQTSSGDVQINTISISNINDVKPFISFHLNKKGILKNVLHMYHSPPTRVQNSRINKPLDPVPRYVTMM